LDKNTNRVVLQRGTGKDETMFGLEHAQVLQQLGVLVFQSVRFVDHQALPVDLVQLAPIGTQDHLVGCQDDVEFELIRSAGGSPLASGLALAVGVDVAVVEPLVLPYDRAVGQVALVDHHVHIGPGLQLSRPVLQGRQGYHHQERPADGLRVEQVFQQADALSSFTQAHFVCQDAASSIEPTVYHPIQTLLKNSLKD